MNFFIDNWIALVGTVFAPILAYILGGRRQQQISNKKGDVEVKKDELDYANETRLYFLNREADYKAEKEELRTEIKSMRDDFTAEKTYYREKQGELRIAIESLQNKFNDISLLYAKEVEQSDLWKQKYYELDKKYTDLKAYCGGLEKKIENLTEKVNEYERTHE